MKAMITFLCLLSIVWSAHASNAADIHFSAQEISMQLRARGAEGMNIQSMCFLIGSTGGPRRTLSQAISTSSMDAGILEEIKGLADSINENAMSLAKFCDGNGKVTLNSVMQPVLTDFTKKPKASEVKGLMQSIVKAADAIVDLNTKAVKMN